MAGVRKMVQWVGCEVRVGGGVMESEHDETNEWTTFGAQVWAGQCWWNARRGEGRLGRCRFLRHTLGMRDGLCMARVMGAYTASGTIVAALAQTRAEGGVRGQRSGPGRLLPLPPSSLASSPLSHYFSLSHLRY